MKRGKSNKQGKASNKREVSSTHQQPQPHRDRSHHHQTPHHHGHGPTSNVTKYNSFINGSTSTTRSTVKINIPGYKTVTESDVMCFKSVFVDDVNGGGGGRKTNSKLKHGQKQAPGFGRKGECNLKARQLATLALNKPTLKNLDKGFNLEEMPLNWCCYSKVWNARTYAHELSSNFSSPKLCYEEEKQVGTADFISDWKNIKALLKSHLTDGHLSFFLHRVGNSVTVNHLDLSSLDLFPGFSDYPTDFIEFIKKVIGKNDEKITLEGRSDDEILSKEAFHKLLYFSMNEPMKVDVSNEKLLKKYPGSESNFLHRHVLSKEKKNILVGCDIPLFHDSESSETTTLRAINLGSGGGGNLRSVDPFDLWLDNTLVECPKTRISYHKDGKISKTEWVKTMDLPVFGKFDLAESLEVGEKLLDFIKENVKVGHSYWLYRAPGTNEILLYNISNIRLEKESKNFVPIFENWNSLETKYFTCTLLMKYGETVADAISHQLPLEIDFEPVGKKSERQTCKSNELKKRLGIWLGAVQKHLPITDDWLIRTLDDINIPDFNRITMCIKGIYETAIQLSPNMKNCLFSHSIEKVFRACFKILRAISPKVSSLEMDVPKFWEKSEAMRKLMSDYMLGMCDILSFLSECHSMVMDWPLDMGQRQEWTYLGCKICVMAADLYSVLSKRHFEFQTPKRRPLQLDKDLPTEQMNLATSYYMKALNQLPQEESFQVKECFVAPSDTNVISKTELVNEINWKLSNAYLTVAQYWATYPSCNYENVPPNSQNLDDDGLCVVPFTSDYYDATGLLLACTNCMKCAEQVKVGKITREAKDERITLMHSSLLRLLGSKEYEAETGKMLLKDLKPTPVFMDIAIALEGYNKRSENAKIQHEEFDSYVIQKPDNYLEDVKNGMSYMEKVAKFTTTGSLVREIDGIQLNMQRLSLESEADPKP